MKIFDTVITPILMYGGKVWGVDHDRKLENDPTAFVQTKFIRWLFIRGLTNSVAQMGADRR